MILNDLDTRQLATKVFENFTAVAPGEAFPEVGTGPVRVHFRHGKRPGLVRKVAVLLPDSLAYFLAFIHDAVALHALPADTECRVLEPARKWASVYDPLPRIETLIGAGFDEATP